jgi:hypothetical protein
MRLCDSIRRFAAVNSPRVGGDILKRSAVWKFFRSLKSVGNTFDNSSVAGFVGFTCRELANFDKFLEKINFWPLNSYLPPVLCTKLHSLSVFSVIFDKCVEFNRINVC